MHDDIERRYSSRARSRAQLMSGVEFGCKDATFFHPHKRLKKLIVGCGYKQQQTPHILSFLCGASQKRNIDV